MSLRLILFSIPALLSLAACATLPEPSGAPGLGPYTSISGRLLVMDPARRWQVMLDWQADSPSDGQARLTHAASGTVVELRWQRNDIRLRDSNAPTWRRVSTAQLAEQGIVLSPYALSQFLAGRIPPGFRETGSNAWERRQNGGPLRVHWIPGNQRLEISDIRHGRRAVLIILKGEWNPPVSALHRNHPHA